jgi:hypothetical protein
LDTPLSQKRSIRVVSFGQRTIVHVKATIIPGQGDSISYAGQFGMVSNCIPCHVNTIKTLNVKMKALGKTFTSNLLGRVTPIGQGTIVVRNHSLAGQCGYGVSFRVPEFRDVVGMNIVAI